MSFGHLFSYSAKYNNQAHDYMGLIVFIVYTTINFTTSR